jgi:hypothetical protein
MFLHSTTLFLFSCCLVLISCQQQEQVFIHPLTNMPGPSEDVETSFFFPANIEGRNFPLGEVATILCHFSNEGVTPLNISAIMGSLNHPYDFRYHIQNYTYKPFGIVVKGGEEVTLQYQFQVHPELEPAEYTLAHTVFYESDREGFSTTFFNQVSSCSVHS